MLTQHKNFKELYVCLYVYTHINPKLDLYPNLHVAHVLDTLLTLINMLAFSFMMVALYVHTCCKSVVKWCPRVTQLAKRWDVTSLYSQADVPC